MSRNHEQFYSQFTQSNEGLIPSELQQIFRQTPIALLGAGMGSQIGIHLVQSGFENFVAITDPDKPETSNLNRQPYTITDVEQGTSKVAALFAHMREINPHVRATLYPSGTTPENAPEIISKAEIIIDAMDPFDALEPAVQVNQLARDQRKPVIFPLELAFTAGVYIFDFTTHTLLDFYNITNYDGGPPTEEQKAQIAITLLKEADDLGRQIAHQFMAGQLKRYPQSPLTTAAASALTVLITQKLIAERHGFNNFLPDLLLSKAPEINKINLLKPN